MSKKRKYPKLWIALGVIFIVFVVLILILSLAIIVVIDIYGTTKCKTKTCFISEANRCKSSELIIQENIGIVMYKSDESFSDYCSMTKTIVELDDKQEMKDLLENKTMRCNYWKGKFDERLVNSLTLGIEECFGELKVTLGDLMIFVN
ncbi:hypothetical protein ACFLZN_00740 [Nanoarchaeota archaeon]